MKEILSQLVANHALAPGAALADFAEAESRLGLTLPNELRALLEKANGGIVWASADHPSRLLPANELDFAGRLLQSDEMGSKRLVAVLSQEPDYVAMDVDPVSSSFGCLVDCSHETFPYELGLVSDSLEGMLELLLSSRGNEWIWPAVLASGRDLAQDG